MIEPTDDMKMAAYRAARAWADEHRGHQQPDDRMIQAAVEAALALVERDQIAPLRSALADLVDPDPCWYDNGGKCQAHGQGSDPHCPHLRAKELL